MLSLHEALRRFTIRRPDGEASLRRTPKRMLAGTIEKPVGVWPAGFEKMTRVCIPGYNDSFRRWGLVPRTCK